MLIWVDAASSFVFFYENGRKNCACGPSGNLLILRRDESSFNRGGMRLALPPDPRRFLQAGRAASGVRGVAEWWDSKLYNNIFSKQGPITPRPSHTVFDTKVCL